MDAEAPQVLDWQNIILGFCFTSVLELAKAKTQLSASFHLLSFAILLTFLFLFVAKLIAQNFILASQVLQKVAIVIAATAFILTTTIPFSAKLKCASWALYGVSLLTIIVCNFVEELVKLKRFFSAASAVFCFIKKYVCFGQS